MTWVDAAFGFIIGWILANLAWLGYRAKALKKLEILTRRVELIESARYEMEEHPD